MASAVGAAGDGDDGSGSDGAFTEAEVAVEVDPVEQARADAASAFDSWLAASAARGPRGVFLWVRRETGSRVLTEVAVHEWTPRGLPADRKLRARLQAEALGYGVVRYAGDGSLAASTTALELWVRHDGPTLIGDVAVAPYAPRASPRCKELQRGGYEPLGVDLGTLGLAAGLQLWVRRLGGEEVPGVSEVERAQLAAVPGYSARLQGVVDLLQLGSAQIEELRQAFAALDSDGDGRIAIGDLLRAMGLSDAAFHRYIAVFLEVDSALEVAATGDASGGFDAAAARSRSFLSGLLGRRKPSPRPTVPGALHVDACAPITLGEFAHCVRTLALMDVPQQTRFAFAYGDVARVLAVSEDTAHCLASDLLACVGSVTSSAGVRAAIRAARRDVLGLITADAWEGVVRASPMLVFPVARMVEGAQRLVFGASWWRAKRARYSAVRADLRKGVDMNVSAAATLTALASMEAESAAVPLGSTHPGAAAAGASAPPSASRTGPFSAAHGGGGAADHQPLTAASSSQLTRLLYVEMLCRRCPLVRQVYVEQRPGQGAVALVVVAPDPALAFSRKNRRSLGSEASSDLATLCLHPRFRDHVLAELTAATSAAYSAHSFLSGAGAGAGGAGSAGAVSGAVIGVSTLPAAYQLKAIHLLPSPFSVANGLMLPEPSDAEDAAAAAAASGPGGHAPIRTPLVAFGGGAGASSAGGDGDSFDAAVSGARSRDNPYAVPLLNRTAIRSRYAKVLELLFAVSAAEQPPWVRARVAMAAAAKVGLARAAVARERAAERATALLKRAGRGRSALAASVSATADRLRAQFDDSSSDGSDESEAEGGARAGEEGVVDDEGGHAPEGRWNRQGSGHSSSRAGDGVDSDSDDDDEDEEEEEEEDMAGSAVGSEWERARSAEAPVTVMRAGPGLGGLPTAARLEPAAGAATAESTSSALRGDLFLRDVGLTHGHASRWLQGYGASGYAATLAEDEGAAAIVAEAMGVTQTRSGARGRTMAQEHFNRAAAGAPISEAGLEASYAGAMTRADDGAGAAGPEDEDAERAVPIVPLGADLRLLHRNHT
jgi:hypothetical protein